MLDLFVGIQVMFGHALVMYREWTKDHLFGHALVIYQEWTKDTCRICRALVHVAFGWFCVGYMFGCILMFWLY